MRLLALDLSTNFGFAVYQNGELKEHGTIWWKERREEFSASRYPFNLLRYTKAISVDLIALIERVSPDEIVVEETTASKDNVSQRILEFIHHGFLAYMELRPEIPVAYVRDGVWKRATGSNQNPDEQKWNAQISRLKAKRKKTLDQDASLTEDERKRLSRLPVKIEGKVVGKKDKKSYYIRSANEKFGLSLKDKDENEAAAILIGLAYAQGIPVCDGTRIGGLLPKAGVV